MTEQVQGRRVALVTGAARRVGACIARRLHADGYDVALHARRSLDELGAVARELDAARPGSTHTLVADLDDAGAPQALVDGVLARFGRLDALVNNASTFHRTPVGSITLADWDGLFASNARAPLFLAQAAADALRTGRGAIVNIVDIYAERPLPGFSVYCMAKAALGAMTLALARELAPDVRVNGVAPGAVLWPENGDDYARRDELVARTPLARTGSPEDIAGAVAWLLHDAPFVTGQILRVDGGRSLAI